ncbi:flagellar motor protein MotB [Pelagerythrobacter marensis]|uniref:Flagellar motor protein MotB n=2 Tax=Pelagerythrobacter marensis TaxID=543877 RepID=A0A0G3X9C7_9SPHN|nr:flagellar motor protein MotB [Pelagerythrobacter marensis]
MASTALASPALARDGQWYIEGQGGPMIVEDLDFDIVDGDGEVVDTVNADTKTGYDFGGVVGYDFGAFRLEADGSYRRAAIDQLVADGEQFDAGGSASALAFMLNGLFDFGDDDGLQGFVGGGAGVARTSVDAMVGGPDLIDDSDTGFAWQALAGVRAPLTDAIDVGLRYRFFNAPNVDLIDASGEAGETRFRSHSILGTLTYNFGGAPAPMVAPPPPPPPPAPTPPPPPPPPPAPVCNKGPYIVFFEFDKSNITPEAATILDNAVSAYTSCGTAAVMLAGHTDRAGSARYNMGLAERRNASVRSYLAGRGVPGARISSEAFGESQPRVPTADGVRELQNRRVEITYGPGSGM